MTNPFTAIAKKYSTEEEQDEYRRNRNKVQAEKLRNYLRINVDEHLNGLEDDRLSCCIVSRPDEATICFVQSIQHQLQESIASELWLTPPENLHITLLEVAHTRPKEEIKLFVNALKPLMSEISSMVKDGPLLNLPLLCFDENAIALSFTSSNFTHSELRLQLFKYASTHKIDILSRYAGPSAHITIARFKRPLGQNEVKNLLDRIASINFTILSHDWQITTASLSSGIIWYGQPGTMFQ